jgi:hypothetical protein
MAFRTTFGVSDGHRKAVTSFLKRVAIKDISKTLRSKKNFILEILHKKTPKIVNTISVHTNKILF